MRNENPGKHSCAEGSRQAAGSFSTADNRKAGGRPSAEGRKQNSALSELSELLQQGEKIVEKSYDDFHAIEPDGDDYLANFKAQAEIWNNAAAQLEDLEEKKNSIDGLDAKSKEAADNYFELTVFSEHTLGEAYDFIVNYFEEYPAHSRALVMQ